MSDSIFSSPRIVNDLVYKTLIESTLAIPWSIDSGLPKSLVILAHKLKKCWVGSKTRGEQSKIGRCECMKMIGAWVVDFCVAQSISGVDHEADYRALTINGEYIWIRDVVHVVRNPMGKSIVWLDLCSIFGA